MFRKYFENALEVFHSTNITEFKTLHGLQFRHQPLSKKLKVLAMHGLGTIFFNTTLIHAAICFKLVWIVVFSKLPYIER
jgi:hypothetical protein